MLTIRNPIEDVENAIPQLGTISDYENRKYINFQAWDNRIKTIVTKNIKKYGQSITESGIEGYFNPCIICVYSDDKLIEINEEKYKLIRCYVTSEKFVNR